MIPQRYIIFIQIFLAVTLFLPCAFAQPLPSEDPNSPVEKPLSMKEAMEQDSQKPVEVNGDRVEFLVDNNTVVAEGNVIIKKGSMTLACDRATFSKEKSIAEAEGHVVLSSPQGSIGGDKMIFDFKNMSGTLNDARIIADPYYGAGESIAKVGDNHMQMKSGYITTCDLDKPHYKIHSKKIDIYPKDKIIARQVKMTVGKVPMFYIPQYTQVINDKKPRVIYTPGFTKDYGAFLLQSWRYYLNDHAKGTIHFDYREKKDLASGVDLKYDIPGRGEGIVKTYYMNERNITSKRVWLEKPSPTIERERFKGEWRHKWTVDPTFDIVSQYYKLSDDMFLKDYFRREYDKDGNPTSFFLLTKRFTTGTLSFRAEPRVNRFTSAVERVPEIDYTLANQRLGDTQFYMKSINTYSNLTIKQASPTEVRRDTQRFHNDSELSYPLRISFLDFRPYVGGRQTYYTKTLDRSQYHSIRGQFLTGIDITTKFYKMFNIEKKQGAFEIHQLRHIVTPSVKYLYANDPTIPYAKLDPYDSIDALTNTHSIRLELENKFQTKRDQTKVDLIRNITATDFRLKEHAGTGGFDFITNDFEFKPIKWLTFYSDMAYDTHNDYLSSANFELQLNHESKWALTFGKRYTRIVDDQITTDFQYVINPKWKFRLYERFDIDHGSAKEHQYTITRDLHCWEMELNFNERRGEGSEIWMVFRLKAFPEMGIDFGSSFNRRKAGSQSSE